MAGLRDLYEEVILDHNRTPRNYPKNPAGANHHARGFNPLCGDQVTIHLTVDGGVITDAGFEGRGCAIATASASLMTEAVKGKTVEEAERLFQGMHAMLTESGEHCDVGKLEVFSGVREYPARVKCATLAWHTLNAALRDKDGTVTTE
jgi:nitrogen fixation NifU-like protein